MAEPEEFVFCVETLRLLGYRQEFGSMWYTSIDVNDYFYWTMGRPVYPQCGETLDGIDQP